MRTEKEIRSDIRELRARMKARGIRRTSMMNGGHSMESMRANQEMFSLETELMKARSHAAAQLVSSDIGEHDSNGNA
jgi:hypothetical protein